MTLEKVAKIITAFILTLIFALNCYGQEIDGQAKNSAILVTKTTVSSSARGNESDTSRILYTYPPATDHYFAFKLTDSTHNEATSYSLSSTNTGLYFIKKRLFGNEEKPDSLLIAFNDPKYKIIVGKTDEYILSPSSYIAFKKQVNEKHNVFILLQLLEDTIGDYPIDELFPIVQDIAGKFSPRVTKAQITTQRNQADSIKDTWICAYRYDKPGNIISVKAIGADQVRFQKTLVYYADSISIKTYRNVEDRQIARRTMNIKKGERKFLHWNEQVIEPGKNLETNIQTTLEIKYIGTIKQADMSKSEVLKLIQQIR